MLYLFCVEVMNAKYLRRGVCEFTPVKDVAYYHDDANVAQQTKIKRVVLSSRGCPDLDTHTHNMTQTEIVVNQMSPSHLSTNVGFIECYIIDEHGSGVWVLLVFCVFCHVIFVNGCC